MTKAPIGTEVFIKKSAITVRDPKEVRRVIVDHVTKKSGIIKAKLDTGEIISFGELTELPCSTMECGNCLYHRRAE
jgi:hypothetical protein